jgi:catechol 2,3-dioxygenase-like lactoylglutathione lyase family enzyme
MEASAGPPDGKGPGWTIDHLAMTVPRLDEAAEFFVSFLGARELYRSSLPPTTDPEAMALNFNAHPAAGYRMAKLQIGDLPLELFEYQAPDLCGGMPRNCDPGGHHIAFLVANIGQAVQRLKECHDVTILGRPSQIRPPHPLAGRSWVYFITPWGQQLELVCDEQRRQ